MKKILINPARVYVNPGRIILLVVALFLFQESRAQQSPAKNLNDIMSSMKQQIDTSAKKNAPDSIKTKTNSSADNSGSTNGLADKINGNAASNGSKNNNPGNGSNSLNNLNNALGETQPQKKQKENRPKTLEELEKDVLNTLGTRSSADTASGNGNFEDQINTINTGQKVPKKRELKDPDDKDIEILNDNFGNLQSRINKIKEKIKDRSVRDGFEERLRRCVLNAAEINNTYFKAYALYLSEVYTRLYIDANFAKLYKEKDEINPSDFLGVIHEIMGDEESDWGTVTSGNLGPLRIPLSIVSEVYSRYQENKRIENDRQINELLQRYREDRVEKLYEQLFQNYSKDIEEYFLTRAESVIPGGYDPGEYITKLYNALDGQISSFRTSQFKNALKKVVYTRIIQNLNTYLVMNNIISYVNEIHVVNGSQAMEMQSLANRQKLDWSNYSNMVVINSKHEGFSDRMRQEMIKLIKETAGINSGSNEFILKYIPIMRVYLDVAFTGITYTGNLGFFYRKDVVGKGTGWEFKPGLDHSPIDCLEPVFEFINPDPDDLVKENRFRNFTQIFTCGKTLRYRSAAGIVQYDYLQRNSVMTYYEALLNNIDMIRTYATTNRLIK